MRMNRARIGAVGAGVAALCLGGLVAPTAAHADYYYDVCNYVDDWHRPGFKQVQCLINKGSDYPYLLSEDGEFGAKTDAAVRWVQDCNDTTGGVDGEAGRYTWLDLHIPSPRCEIER